jgi:DNA-binding GntR family transcriptional regulator
MTLKLEAYTTIKQRILNCEYPPDSFFNEEKLRDDLQMSRTPIRDALSRLEQESLVKIFPKKGFIITGISENEIEDIYELRMLIEPFALLEYGREIDKNILKEYGDFFSKYDVSVPEEKIFAMDDRLHHLFINATKNKYFVRVYGGVYNQIVRIRILSGHNEARRLRESQREHRAVIRSCLRRDWPKAAEELRIHLLRSKEIAFEASTKKKNQIYTPSN